MYRHTAVIDPFGVDSKTASPSPRKLDVYPSLALCCLSHPPHLG